VDDAKVEQVEGACLLKGVVEMPKFLRDKKSGAVVIEYTKEELEDSIGYRLLKLEKRVEELEKVLKELFYILKEDRERRNGKRRTNG